MDPNTRTTEGLDNGDKVYVTGTLPIRPTRPNGTSVIRTVQSVTVSTDHHRKVTMTDGFTCVTDRFAVWYLA